MPSSAYIEVRPHVTLALWKGHDVEFALLFDGMRRHSSPPLSEADVEQLEEIAAGQAVEKSTQLVDWLVETGCARLSRNPPVQHPSWSGAFARQLSAYSEHAGADAAFRIHRSVRGSTVLIVGVGGLGCNIAQQLVRMGVRRFVLVDHDRVEESNLNRQVLYTERDVGSLKVAAASRRLAEISPTAEVSQFASCLADALSDGLSFANLDMIFVSADSDPAALRRTVSERAYPAKVPYTFVAYSGARVVVGPTVSDFAHGCGCCAYHLFSPDDGLRVVSGNGVRRIPSSSAAVNAVAAGLAVDQWTRSLGQGCEPKQLRVDLKRGCANLESSLRLSGCPVCGARKQ